AAAVYGLDASSVIIITTKRGAALPSKINFTASYGITTNTEMLELLDGPQFAYWWNKAREMDGNSPVFSQEHVRKMLAGEGGWGNTNWYKETFGTGTNANYNVNASGGTDNLKYFVSLG
ncbi:MAG TPA: SusC/RagA family protein, partial [Clostridiales bacterium]|nr:SusC/RagA family protein [Clostridiales bacterium]